MQISGPVSLGFLAFGGENRRAINTWPLMWLHLPLFSLFQRITDAHTTSAASLFFCFFLLLSYITRRVVFPEKLESISVRNRFFLKYATASRRPSHVFLMKQAAGSIDSLFSTSSSSSSSSFLLFFFLFCFSGGDCRWRSISSDLAQSGNPHLSVFFLSFQCV